MSMRFTKEHLWVEGNGETFKMGISGFAVSALDGLTYLDTGNSQRVVKSGEDLGSIESTKAAEALVCPFDLEVVSARNPDDIKLEDLEKNPEDPNNWLFEVKPIGEYKDKLIDDRDYAIMMGMPDEDPPYQTE